MKLFNILIFLLLGQFAFSQDIQKEIIIDPRMQVTLGGWESVKDLEENLTRMIENGVTSHEVYVPWGKIEMTKGEFDFSDFDPMVEQYNKSGMKWVPFLIMGPAYSLPDWFYKSKEDHGYVCLEHGQVSDVQSLWNPNLPDYVDGFIKAFADHYRDTGVIESVLLGITGNYGEAIYVASGNDWTADRHGKYHTHHGFWCGDKYAVIDFQNFLTKKYRTISQLNKKWKLSYKSFGEIKPQLQKDWNSDRAWLDQMEWYRESMLHWADFWLKTTRKYFPDTQIYLCTGGVDLQNWLGADFSAQSKLTKKYNAGIRITNEASDYNYNFTLTRMVSSACKFYNTFYGFEPAGHVSEKGVIARVYNATASGAIQLHYYSDNIFGNEERIKNWQKSAPYLKYRQPQVTVAVLYPKIYSALKENRFIERDKQLRDILDHDYVDENMINDGALDQYKYLVIVEGNIWPDETYRKINQWIKKGGIFIAPEDIGKLLTIDRDDKYNELFFPKESVSSDRKIYRFTKSDGNYDIFCRFVGEITGINTSPQNGLYITRFMNGSELLYDSDKSEILEIPAVHSK